MSIARNALCGALLLALSGTARAQVDTLELLEAAQKRMDATDALRNRPAHAVWAKRADSTQLVRLDPMLEDKPVFSQLYMVYTDADGIAAVSSVRYLGADSTLDASTHYFDTGGRTVAVRWELTTRTEACGPNAVVWTREQYFTDKGQRLEEWTWLTDMDGNELEPPPCKVQEPKGRMPAVMDRKRLLELLRIPKAD